MIYAGIGSRSTPQAVIDEMVVFAALAARRGWVLRSGAAKGADQAFERGCNSVGGASEIFLPWRKFEQHQSKLHTPTPDAFRLAKEIHPMYGRLGKLGRSLIARNMHQILGENLDSPVRCVVCWTADGCESIETYSKSTGGTGSAVALASTLCIPVFNMKNWNRGQEAIEFLEER